MWGNFFREVPPHPFKNLLTKGVKKQIRNVLIDSRRERDARFGCREKVWEYKNTDRKYLIQMLNEQVAMGFIEEDDI